MNRTKNSQNSYQNGKSQSSSRQTLAAYGELMRVHRPLGFYLNTSPYIVGVAFASSISSTQIPLNAIAQRTMLLAAWSFCLRCGGCVWNDLVDADLDRQVSRTRSRPIPRGAVSKADAALLALVIFACGWYMVFFLPRACIFDASIITVSALIYPFGKRYTDYPQLTLANIGWAIPMAMHSFELKPLARLKPTLCMYMFIATVIIMIDVIYSRQDTEDDTKAGVRSMAVRFRDSIHLVAYSLLIASTVFLATAGALTGLGLPFFIVSVAGHFVGFSILLQASRVGKSSKVEAYSKSAFFLATVFWVLGFVIENCLGH
ncbi:UbiA prenyltransferase family [Penicillium cataractarum]|uniref:UbiA prenyltransferase family n=1 Tax=Penicillium cataractarum TaxID=2100454 RepID=A0A9W9VTM2_9EURO|nr:UbiA prenyltransferase family [Penicillium cataractarum]KAJ5388989.1 UbiA prenyltransferase family [Penicillium cataractarum]